MSTKGKQDESKTNIKKTEGYKKKRPKYPQVWQAINMEKFRGVKSGHNERNL
jgi:hypothetical protein